MAQQPFYYGGQAVIEGVMIRGRSCFSLAVRRENGNVQTISEPLSEIFTGRVRRVPFLRGMLVLAETLILGIKALNRSATIALKDQTGEEEEVPNWVMGLSLGIALALGVVLFFIMPLLAVHFLDDTFSSDQVINLLEGIIRLAILVGYVALIGRLRDIQRVFMYHGAEHMAVHTHEAGLPLDVGNVRRFPTAHPRCGTAFLLTVVLVAIVVFAFVPRSNLAWLVTSRVVLIPVIAAISYEIIRFSGAHQTNPLTRLVTYPGLLLQRLTTRIPDDAQIEVAIQAMETAIATDEGREPVLAEQPTPATQTEASEADGGEASP